MTRWAVYTAVALFWACVWGWQSWALATGRGWISDAHWHFYVACGLLWVLTSGTFITLAAMFMDEHDASH